MLLAATAALTSLAGVGAPSALAAGSVTIKTSFENSPISLNTSDAVGYALTNNTGSSQTVTFTDALPAGVTLDSPIGTAATNGTGSCTLTPPAANPGDSSVTLTVAVPSETASGSVCTISFNVVAGTPSSDHSLHDSYSSVTTLSALKPTTTAGSLIVLANPTLSLTAPANNQSFYLGQSRDASFECATSDPLDSIDSFFGTDDEGNQIESGAPIDTLDPGAHTLQVDCYSAVGGGDVSQTVSYTVGSYALSGVREAKKTDRVSFKTLVPAGRIVAKLLDGKKAIGTGAVAVASRRTANVTVKPNAAGRKLLAAAKGRALGVKLEVSFMPQPIGTGNAQIAAAGATVVTRSIRLPISHAARTAAAQAQQAARQAKRAG